MPLVSKRKRFSFGSYGIVGAPPALCTGGTPLTVASPDDPGTFAGFNMQTFDGALDPMGSLTADRIGAIGSGGSCILTQDKVLSAGVIYQVNAYIKKSVSDWCALIVTDFSTHSLTQYLNANTGSKGASAVGGTDLSFDCASIAPDVDGFKFARIQFKSTAGGTYKVGIAVVGGDNSFGVAGTEEVIVWHLLGLYQTNLMTFGRDFTNAAWTKNASSIVANTTTGYDGAAVADTLKEDTANSPHSTNQNFTKAASALPYKFFAKVKPLGTGSFRRAVMVLRSGSNGIFCVFDLSTGVLDVPLTPFGSGFSAITASLTSVAGGWKNLLIEGTSDTTTTIGCEVQLDAGTSGNTFATNSYTGDGASGLFIDDARLFQIA